MEKKTNPWIICAAGTLLVFCTVGLSTSAFSVYQPYLISVLGLTNAQSSLFLTIRTLSGLAATFVVQEYLNRLGLRNGAFAAGLMIFAAFILLGAAKGFAGAVISAVLLGAGYGLGGMVAVSVIINRAFAEHMGLALSICAAGTGVSAIISPPIVTWAVERFSLKCSLFAEAVIILIAVTAVFMVLKSIPCSKAVTASKKSEHRFSYLLKNRELRLCLLIMLFLGTIANVGWSHLSVLYKTAGMSATQVALLISLSGAFLTVGKLAFGGCLDLLGERSVFTISGVMMVIGLVLACLAGRCILTLGIVSMLLLGLSLPMGTLCPGLFSRIFAKPDKFDYAVSKLQLMYMLGALVFGPIPGVMADASGSYVSSFMVMTCFGVVICILIIMAFSVKKNR